MPRNPSRWPLSTESGHERPQRSARVHRELIRDLAALGCVDRDDVTIGAEPEVDRGTPGVAGARGAAQKGAHQRPLATADNGADDAPDRRPDRERRRLEHVLDGEPPGVEAVEVDLDALAVAVKVERVGAIGRRDSAAPVGTRVDRRQPAVVAGFDVGAEPAPVGARQHQVRLRARMFALQRPEHLDKRIPCKVHKLSPLGTVRCMWESAFVHHSYHGSHMRSKDERLTGDLLRQLRQELGFDAFQFAHLLGVHVSTIYRWESQDAAEVRMDPLQRQILYTTITRFRHTAADRKAELGQEILKALLAGGALFGLLVLLEFLKNERPR